MAAPPKPWERNLSSTTNNLRSTGLPSLNVESNRGLYARQPPAPPPRPARQSTSRYTPMSSSYGYGGSYSSMYSPYSSMYGGGGHYGSGLGYGGYNRFGYDNNQGNSSFSRIAEESSRPAFQSIESIVQAFGSVSMMLESTYSAVYNSFRAVLGVADHFTQLRTHFAQVFSAFAIVRSLRYLYRRLLVFLRLRQSGLEEDVWLNASEADVSQSLELSSKKRKSSWPILMFLAVVLGGPYLIWKLLSSVAAKEGDCNWASGEDEHFVAVAEYDFDGENDDELTFRVGQKIRIAPKDLQPRMRGWLLASVDGKKTGIIPANYVKLQGRRPGSKHVGTAAPPPTDTLQSSQLLVSQPNLEKINSDTNISVRDLENPFSRTNTESQFPDFDDFVANSGQQQDKPTSHVSENQDVQKDTRDDIDKNSSDNVEEIKQAKE